MQKIHPKVEEAVSTLDLNPLTRRRLLSGTGLISTSLAAGALLSACSQDKQQAQAAGVGNFPTTPKWKFTFVNHVTTNSFFTPTQYGMEDAATLLGIDKPQWTGRRTRSWRRWSTRRTPQSAPRWTGLAIAVVDKNAFRAPVDQALRRRHTRCLVQRRRRARRSGHQPAGVHRAGPVRVRLRAGPAGAAGRRLR
jgi:simple sugar transport system substrate-binding protein